MRFYAVCVTCGSQTLRPTSAKYCFPCLKDRPKATGAVSARIKVRSAVKRGHLQTITTRVCVDCGAPANHYDHRDYNKPLDVVPVCHRCNLLRGAAIPLKRAA